MTPQVYEVLGARREVQGNPTDGWVFPSNSVEGHLGPNTTKDQHAKAFAVLEEIRKQNPALPEVKYFEPYVLRHTALTRFAEAVPDVYALAKIAGHSSIVITQRYIHEGADSVDRVFAKREQLRKALPSVTSATPVGTKVGTIENAPAEE